jgi:hypothetical protein
MWDADIVQVIINNSIFDWEKSAFVLADLKAHKYKQFELLCVSRTTSLLYDHLSAKNTLSCDNNNIATLKNTSIVVCTPENKKRAVFAVDEFSVEWQVSEHKFSVSEQGVLIFDPFRIHIKISQATIANNEFKVTKPCDYLIHNVINRKASPYIFFCQSQVQKIIYD